MTIAIQNCLCVFQNQSVILTIIVNTPTKTKKPRIAAGPFHLCLVQFYSMIILTVL